MTDIERTDPPYDERGDAELTARVEEDAAEAAQYRADEAAELAAEQDEPPALRLPAGVRLTTAGELRAELAGDGPRCAFCGNLYAACVCAYPPASVSLARHDGGADPVGALNQLGAIWSPDLDAYAAGQLDPAAIRCALCQHAPCQCPPAGTPEYFALVARRHGRKR